MKRATLLVPSPSQDDKYRKHLFIILTDAQGNDRCVLMVSIASMRLGRFVDDTCRLYCGDHDFIKHDSFVHYRKTEIIAANKLIQGVKNQKLTYKGIIDDDVFQRISQGILQSVHTPRKAKNFFQAIE